MPSWHVTYTGKKPYWTGNKHSNWLILVILALQSQLSWSCNKQRYLYNKFVRLDSKHWPSFVTYLTSTECNKPNCLDRALAGNLCWRLLSASDWPVCSVHSKTRNRVGSLQLPPLQPLPDFTKQDVFGKEASDLFIRCCFKKRKQGKCTIQQANACLKLPARKDVTL